MFCAAVRIRCIMAKHIATTMLVLVWMVDLMQPFAGVVAHNHINWERWNVQLADANCSTNYSSMLSATSRKDNDGDWVSSPACFDMYMKFLSIAGCKYFALVDCGARCDETTEGNTPTNDSVVDDFGNAEFSYCELFCRNRESLHPPDGGTELLGCVHSANASRCGCPLDSCGTTSSTTTTAAAASNDIDSGPEWCELYCDKVSDSCTVAATESGCAFAEARATIGGSLVNISRTVAFSLNVSSDLQAATGKPALDDVCSSADQACVDAADACAFQDVVFSGVGTESASVSGRVTGLLDAPVDAVLPALLVDPQTNAPPATVSSITLEPRLDMLCLGAVRVCFGPHFPPVIS